MLPHHHNKISLQIIHKWHVRRINFLYNIRYIKIFTSVKSPKSSFATVGYNEIALFQNHDHVPNLINWEKNAA